MGERWSLAATWGAALLVFAVVLWMLGDLLWRGLPGLSLSFLIEMPRDAGRAGGIAPILVSTLLILLVAMGTALPLATATAVWLSEFAPRRARLQRWVRLALDMLAGVPSIVFGLFGNAVFAIALGLGFSILSGGLTLACMVLPILIRTTTDGLCAVPQELRLGGAALGMSQLAIVTRLLLPAALPALLVGSLLGSGRALAETAALVFTSGYVDRYAGSLFDSGRALSVHIYELSMNVPGGESNAYASAAVLIGLIVLINLATRALGRRWLGGAR